MLGAAIFTADPSSVAAATEGRQTLWCSKTFLPRQAERRAGLVRRSGGRVVRNITRNPNFVH